MGDFCATLRSIFDFSAMQSSRVIRWSCAISLSVKPAARSPSHEQARGGAAGSKPIANTT